MAVLILLAVGSVAVEQGCSYNGNGLPAARGNDGARGGRGGGSFDGSGGIAQQVADGGGQDLVSKGAGAEPGGPYPGQSIDGPDPQEGAAVGGAAAAVGGASSAGASGLAGGSPAPDGGTADGSAGGRRTDGRGPSTGGGGGGPAGAGRTDSGIGGTAGPTILSIDFVGGVNASGAFAGAPGQLEITPAPALSPTDIAGFNPAAHWNSAFGPSGLLSPLALSDGTAVDASLRWDAHPTTNRSGVWRLSFATGTADAVMMDGYLDPPAGGSPAEVIVADLPLAIASRGYDVYVYCLGDISSAAESRTYRYTIGLASISVLQTGPVPATFPGYEEVGRNNDRGNFVVFRNVRGATFTLTASPGIGISTRAPLNGLQIVSPSTP